MTRSGMEGVALDRRLNRDVVVAVYSYDNEEAQLEMLAVLSRREFYARRDPFYTHVQKHNEVT